MSRRKRKSKQKVKADQLAPDLAKGFTQDVPAEEALSYFPDQARDGVDTIAKVAKVDYVPGTRIPTPRFIATDSDDSIMVEPATGRIMRDANIVFNDETRRSIQAGLICLRCYEPQAESFPAMCDLCGYSMRERQIMDFAVESEGHVHVGPGKTTREYLDEQSERLAKRAFIKRILDGGQGAIPADWLKDKGLVAGLTADELRALGAKT